MFPNNGNNPFLPSQIINCIFMPLRAICSIPNRYNLFASCLTYYLYKICPDKLSLKTMTPNPLTKYVVSINTFATLGNVVLR